MIKLLRILGGGVGWFVNEYAKDYRESNDHIYGQIVKTDAQINQIILTVSIASLVAVAALNEAVFIPYGLLAFIAIFLFVLAILLSVINLYLVTLTLADMQQKLIKNLSSFTTLNKGMRQQRFQKTRRVFNVAILSSFCFGLISFLILLGLYILGGK